MIQALFGWVDTRGAPRTPSGPFLALGHINPINSPIVRDSQGHRSGEIASKFRQLRKSERSHSQRQSGFWGRAGSKKGVERVANDLPAGWSDESDCGKSTTNHTKHNNEKIEPVKSESTLNG
jgi:hypothetical protein